ncbi:MAG TPA: VOC family protein, partial [Acidimicrobiales bacterium]|nr:VOC family protein [Acidimicrobiales bacterium]
TMEVIDSGLARSFYASVLGWRFEPGRVEDGWGPVDVAPMMGMHGGQPQMVVVPMYRIDDINSGVERVRRAGGTATDPEQLPYGWSSVCEDDQGTRFYLGEH